MLKQTILVIGLLMFGSSISVFSFTPMEAEVPIVEGVEVPPVKDKKRSW